MILSFDAATTKAARFAGWAESEAPRPLNPSTCAAIDACSCPFSAFPGNNRWKVSLDTSSKPVKKYVKKTMVNYPVVMGDADVVKDFGNFSGIPQTYVIDKDGIIRLSQVGQISKEKLLAGIKPLL